MFISKNVGFSINGFKKRFFVSKKKISLQMKKDASYLGLL